MAEWHDANGGAFGGSDAFAAGHFDDFADAGAGGAGDDRACYTCGQTGHMKSQCPEAPAMTCNHCGQEGHMRRDCPDKPAQMCHNCGEEGHLALTCQNPRKIDRSAVEDIDAEKAWEQIKEAAQDKDVFDFKDALTKYLKHYPDLTYTELEAGLRDSDMKVWIIATEREILPTMTLMDLQGNLNKKWSIGYRFSPKAERPRELAIWPKSMEENLERLADAGEPVPNWIPHCLNCKEMGHTSKYCPTERAESEKVVIRCYNCDTEGHRVRDCPEPRKDKFACRNCGQPGHKASDCTEPRNADNVECNKCHEMGHFSRDCPQGGGRACRNCGEEGHIAKECTEPRRMQCRNCDEYGHSSKECPKPFDVSRIKCNNCGEMGHKKIHCKNPTQGDVDDFGQNNDAANMESFSTMENSDTRFDGADVFGDANVPGQYGGAGDQGWGSGATVGW